MSNANMPSRNDPCWCGSGKKFKKCHLNRESQERSNLWDVVAANKKAFHTKTCFAKDSGFGECEGKIIKAHTVSRGPNLSKIARNSHVVRYNADPKDLSKNGCRLTVSEVGTSEASVFLGFCAGHDRTLFSCIENEPFTGRPDQCLAIAYRTLSKEYYGKNASTHLPDILRDADKGWNLIEQVALQRQLDRINEGIQLSKRELKLTHDTLTKMMTDYSDDVLASMIVQFEGTLPFMLAGAWSPLTDLFGGKLQNGFVHELLEQVFVSTFATDGGSQLCVSWLNKPQAPGRAIAEQIRSLPPETMASACLQFSVKHVENVYFNPIWFEGLDKNERKQLDVLTMSGVDNGGEPPRAPINLELAFQLPRMRRVLGP